MSGSKSMFVNVSLEPDISLVWFIELTKCQVLNLCL
jgi:hypothetical protein